MSDTKNSGESLLWVNVDCWSPAGQRGSKAWVLFQQAGEEEQIVQEGFRCANGQQHTLLEINYQIILTTQKSRQWWQSKWKGEPIVKFNAEKMR